jgi:hypothetical protein
VIALLDVNVLVALLDPVHVHHEPAHAWFATQRGYGWATSPITENGFVRVMSNPAYPGRRVSIGEAIAHLTRFRTSAGHTFWSEPVSLTDPGAFRPEHIGGHRQLTDVYLLALATVHGGCLATFDRGLSVRAVAAAKAENLMMLG